MNISINGFGRIGRNFLRCVMEDPKARKTLRVMGVNLGPMSEEAACHLFKYDTLLGTYNGTVELKNNTLVVDGQEICLSTEREPARCPWSGEKVHWVVESSGCFTNREASCGHLVAGAQKVLVTAPMTGEDISIIPGVNMTQYDPQKHTIVSLGSCTTNALMPMLKVLLEECGLLHGFMNTIHAYTNDQVILDTAHKDLRRARAAAINIIPTTTGAAKMVTKLFPQLEGKMPCVSIRVPVAKVSLLDVVFTANTNVSADIINNAFKKAASGNLKSIVAYSDEPLVSTDYYKNSASVTIDSLMTQGYGAVGRVYGWYDNEWGYSERLKDFLMYAASK